MARTSKATMSVISPPTSTTPALAVRTSATPEMGGVLAQATAAGMWRGHRPTVIQGSRKAVLRVGVLVGCLLAGACGNAATPTPKTKPVAVIRSPISGRAVTSPDQRVLVVKIENTAGARPQLGLASADMVFVEEVEGGITRFAAVFSSQRPETVGPIRSARITDPQLVAQFGHVAFTYSGAQARMSPVLAAANLTQVRERRNSGWTRSTERHAPHNLYGHPTGLLEQAGEGIAVASNMGRTFSDSVPAGGVKVASVRAAYPAEAMTIDWLQGNWTITSGRDIITDGTAVHPADVLIQYVTQSPSQFHDRHGGVTPFAETVGTGTGLFLRNGQSWPVTWKRTTESDPTTWFDAMGQPLVFKPGTIWNLLIPKERPVGVTAPAAKASTSPSP
jgi:Protein of unknown function (DUF3048) N-terminal domain/Protein of unknown function (DUF3048) C-terminal domain